MNNFKTIVFLFTKITFLLSLSLIISGCGSSSDDSEKYGYVKFYNASPNAPDVIMSLSYDDGDKESYGTVGFGETTYTQSIISRRYSLELQWQEDNDEYNTIEEREIQITDDDVKLVILTGDFYSPNIIEFDFEQEDEELHDDTDEDNFSLYVINTDFRTTALDIYLSLDDETFNEAILVTSATYGIFSSNNYLDVDSYKIYLTETGSNEVLFESNEVNFSQNINYILSVRADTGPGNSEYSVDVLSYNSRINLSDINSGTELRFYNGITEHELIADYASSVDVQIKGLEADEIITGLTKGTMSTTYELPASDYSIDILASTTEVPLAENHFVSLAANDDVTVFLYLNEVEVEVDDGPDEIEIYVNSLPVDNSNRVSIYDHQIKVINLIQDERFNQIRVYFVRSNETVSTADYSVVTSLAVPKSVTVPNNTYSVNLISTVDDSDLLLHFQEITLSEDDGDYFLVLDKEPNNESGYSAQLIPQ